MRRFQILQTTFTGVRILLVVAGMLSVVAMMGATAKQDSPRNLFADHSLLPKPHGLAHFAETYTANAATELLYDQVDQIVGQIEPGVRQVRMEVTAYCACSKCCGPNAVGITASGHDTSYNNSLFVAADPSLPFGTKMLIPGYSDSPVEVIDRGSAIRGDKIDVFFASHEDAVQWGRRQLLVTIVE